MTQPNGETNTPRQRKRRWLKLAFYVSALIVLAGVWGFRRLTAKPANPAAILADTLVIDPQTPDRMMQQWRASNLAILGREDLVLSARLDSIWDQKAEPAAIRSDIRFERWKDVLPEIAATNRLVMIAENHLTTVTRDWISKTLPIFQEAGFTHYCAEAIAEPAVFMRWRGGPNHQTGYYTADPRFGSLIRRAMSMQMIVAGYDFWPFSHDARENYAANALCKIARKPDSRLLVHAGPGHVAKYETENGSRWLAARMWDKSGIEPYTVYQMTDLDEPETRNFLLERLRVQVGADEELSDAFVWRPEPETIEEFRQAQFDIPKVDMIVIHPPSTVTGPALRMPFAGHATQLDGSWTGKRWPVVISAYGDGASMDAIPFDQVLLREGESNFRLWVPDNTAFVLRAFNSEGQLALDAQLSEGRWILK